ncbi:MAG: TonB-dependent receptor [Bacteroidota bacterium]
MKYFLTSLCLYSYLVLLLGSNTLTAQQDTVPWSIDLDDVVVTAQFAPTAAEEAVHHVDVIKSDEWKARGLNTVSEVLQQELNLRVSPDPILGNGLSIQGLGGQNVQIMIDGVPVVGRLGGNIDLNQLNLSQFERVEIVMGSMAAQYGSNASGGVINLISKQHQVGGWQFEAMAQLESFGLQQQNARLGRKFNDWQIDGGVFRYQATFEELDSLRSIREVTDSEGETFDQRVVPWNPKDQLGYDVNVSYRPSDSLRIRYGFRGFTETLLLPDAVNLPDFPDFSYSDDSEFTTVRQDHHLAVEKWFSPRWYWKVTAGLNTFDRYREDQRLYLAVDTADVIGRDTTRYTGTLLRSSLSFLSNDFFSGQLGLEYFRESAAGGRIIDTANNDLAPGMYNLASWVNLRFQLVPPLVLETNLRVGHNSRYRHPIVPAFNLRWQPTTNWSLRLGYARGFRAPSLQRLFFQFIDASHYITGNENLLEEDADNFRLQLDWGNKRAQRQGDNIAASLGVQLFHNTIRNRIVLVEDNRVELLPWETPRFTYGNLGIYQTFGGNLSFDLGIDKYANLRISGGYSRLRNPRYDDDSSLPQFISLWEMSNSLSLRLPTTRSSLELNHRYIGRQDRYTSDADGNINLGFVEGFHLVDLSLQQPFWEDRILLGVGVKNLFDRESVAVTGGGGGGAHSGGVNSQLVAFGRNYFLRLAFQIGTK